MRMTGNEAAVIIKDDSLDFIYIDARHDYLAVLEDLTGEITNNSKVFLDLSILQRGGPKYVPAVCLPATTMRPRSSPH